jgi:N-acetylmuramate 1-kinase
MARQNLFKEFLAQNLSAISKIENIASDASKRNYLRVFVGNKKFIAMDAPPQFEDVRPFCHIDEFLIKNGFSAPQILAQDIKNGFLLLEDFGDDSYRQLLEKEPQKEEEIYYLAVDLLVELHKKEVPRNLPIYDENLLQKELALFTDWYLPNFSTNTISTIKTAEFKEIWQELLTKLSNPKILTLRDYHADNLMFLPQRLDVKKVGLLDFQDAVIGHEAYDLVSLLEDARRDVDLDLAHKMIKYYAQKSSCDEKQFLLDYDILSLQRNLKIIGIFARLALRDNKENYLKLLPRVSCHVKHRLEQSSNTVIFQPIGNFLKYYDV